MVSKFKGINLLTVLMPLRQEQNIEVFFQNVSVIKGKIQKISTKNWVRDIKN